jgi:5-methylcytosine-specific restriction endonuclease McrA
MEFTNEELKKRMRVYRSLKRFIRSITHTTPIPTAKQQAESRRHSKRYGKTMRGRFSAYKHNAKRRGFKFLLSYDKFSEICRMPCHYCGNKEKVSGIDRVHSDAGYEIWNCVPACTQCNRAKSAMGYHAFVVMCVKVAKNHEKKLSEKADLSKMFPVLG